MKLKSISPFLFFFGLSIMVLVTACKEPDIKLVNKVKNFEPRWATLSEKMSYLDRNLSQAEKRFEKDFEELEGMFGVIADSLRGRRYRAMLKEYDTLVMERDTIRLVYDADKQKRTESVDEFNDWEKKVMRAEIETEQGLKELKAYKATQSELEARTDSLTVILGNLFGRHNEILRKLSEMMEIYTNYDIRMQ